MMHKAWSSIEEEPYCFSRSSIKFQGHIALEIVEFDSNWAFPDCNSSLNSMMAMKCCTKLETAKKRCPIVFQGHPSNFKVTRDKTSPILTQIGRFGLQAGRSFQIPQICLVVVGMGYAHRFAKCYLLKTKISYEILMLYTYWINEHLFHKLCAYCSHFSCYMTHWGEYWLKFVHIKTFL